MTEEVSDPFEGILRSEALQDAACRLPGELLSTYARLREFETWLRMMVYVELRARYGDDWETHLNEGNTGDAQSRDERLSHMPTLERLPTSYMQLSGILSTVSDRWCLFRPYLPPREIWEATMKEILQVRHRIAHFRRGHRHDADRVAQLLRDLDLGFWQFCLSYNDADRWSSEDDAVTREVASHETARDKVRLHLARSARPWSLGTEPFEGSPGGFYDAVIHATRDWQFGYESFLAGTVGVHGRVCLIHLDEAPRSVRVTVPSVIGVSAVADTLGVCKRAAENAVRPWSGKLEAPREPPIPLRAWQAEWVDELAEPYGEFILGPMHMLSFMDTSHLRGRPGSFFAVRPTSPCPSGCRHPSGHCASVRGEGSASPRRWR